MPAVGCSRELPPKFPPLPVFYTEDVYPIITFKFSALLMHTMDIHGRSIVLFIKSDKYDI